MKIKWQGNEQKKKKFPISDTFCLLGNKEVLTRRDFC